MNGSSFFFGAMFGTVVGSLVASFFAKRVINDLRASNARLAHQAIIILKRIRRMKRQAKDGESWKWSE